MKTIKLTQGKVTKVDDEDFEELNKWKWRYLTGYTGSMGYAATESNDGGIILMHQQIMGMQGIDHKDRDSLNNQKENLRYATKSNNMANRPKQKNNTSGYKGVTFNSLRGYWIAQIKARGETHYLGKFKTKEEAAARYNRAAVFYFGEFAMLNELPQELVTVPQ